MLNSFFNKLYYNKYKSDKYSYVIVLTVLKANYLLTSSSEKYKKKNKHTVSSHINAIFTSFLIF